MQVNDAKERHQNSGEIPYLYNRVAYPLPPLSLLVNFPVAQERRVCMDDMMVNLTQPTMHRNGLRKLYEAIRDLQKHFLSIIGYLGDFSLRVPIFTRKNSQAPSPVYLYILKIPREFHLRFEAFPKGLTDAKGLGAPTKCAYLVLSDPHR